MKDEWMDYFGRSTVIDCGSHGLHVHHPGTGERAEYAEDDAEQGSSKDGDPGRLGQDYGRDDTGKEEKQEMTHEQFKDICLDEFPFIESMVKKVKALGVDHVACTVHANGTLDFQVHEADNRAFHTAWHQPNMAQGELQIVEYDGQGKAEWKPRCFYDHAIDNDSDATEDDLPFC